MDEAFGTLISRKTQEAEDAVLTAPPRGGAVDGGGDDRAPAAEARRAGALHAQACQEGLTPV